jgi:hypothetical protein
VTTTAAREGSLWEAAIRLLLARPFAGRAARVRVVGCAGCATSDACGSSTKNSVIKSMLSAMPCMGRLVGAPLQSSPGGFLQDTRE